MAGKIVHFELSAKDAKRAQHFYSTLFGWSFHDANMPGGEYYLTDDGAIDPGAAEPGPYVYFGVKDIDAAIRTVRELGGTSEEKQPVPGEGWFARVTDTEGNRWALFEPDRAAAFAEPEHASATPEER